MERVALLLLLSLLIGLGEGRKDGGIYDVLGVSSDASQREIRSAYKRLARVWHPDKNKSPQAQEKILEINKAYEVLSGEESRRRYDMTGETDPTHSGSHSHAHNSHGFTFFQTGDGFFHFGGFGQATQPREDTITTHYFKNVVLPESSSRLWLLYFFGDFCFQCEEVSRIWDELKTELESNGVGMASVHGSRQYDVTSHCNIDRIPAIVAVVNRRVSHYRGHLQARNIRSFVKNALPSWIITELTAEGVEAFITESVSRNRPRLVLFSPHPTPSLVYKAVAFSNQLVTDFGFITTYKPSGKGLGVLQRYGVSQRSKKLLVFKEYPHPAAVLEGSEVTGEVLRSLMKGLSLHLPRLTSQQALDSTCGSNGRLCLILVVKGSEAYNDTVTGAFRLQAIQSGPRFSLAYIDRSTQRQFIDSFPGANGSRERCENGQESRDVLLLRRKTSFHSSYNWFSGYCGSNVDFDNLLDFAGQTSFKTTTKLVPNLLDEFAPGILIRMWEKITEIYYQVYDSATANSQVLSLLTMTGVMASLLCCASVLGASQITEETTRRPRARKKHASHRDTSDPCPLVIPPLTAQLYIEEAHKGSVSILILLDSVAKDHNLAVSDIFKRHKRQHVFFFWGALENYSCWLTKLLEASSMNPEEVETRKRFYYSESERGRVCVLALFGAKKKFAIFPESMTTSSIIHRGNCSENSATENCESLANGGVNEENSGVMVTVMGSVGFEEDAPGHREEEEGEIERGLRVWMERLEDGSLKRYSTDSWPSWQ